jgi:predicted phage terminase large subunit-like protein
MTENLCPKCSPEGKCDDCAAAEGEAMKLVTQCAQDDAKKAKNSAKASKRARKSAPKRAKTRELTRKAQAQQEIARRELARRNLLAFVLRNEPDYRAGWVHKVIAQELMTFSEQVVREEAPRLMITMPPRHGKSLLASQYWPAWHLGNHPGHEFINTSYAQSLQMDFSRKIQELVRSEDYHHLFGNLGVTKKNEAVERWSLYDYDKEKRTGGGVLAAGIGGPISGRGAHIFLIDDPVKNREEAESSTLRETAKSWYSSTAYTRLAPGAGIVVIQTRWHDDDLSGHLLSEMREAEKEMKVNGDGIWPEDADKWRTIDFPAIATTDEKYRSYGTALHPERYDLKALRKIKRTLAPRDWAALYQQNPQVEEGAYFQKKYFKFWKTKPDFLDVYCAGDLAISKKEHADWSVFYVAGKDADGQLYMLDEYRGRWDANEIVEKIFEIHRLWHPRKFGLEKGQISLTLDGFIQRRKREEKLYELHIEELPPGKQDKELRARTIQGLMSLGQVWWPEGALWVDDAMNEMLRFPSGVKDDRVDAAAWIGKMTADAAYVGEGAPKAEKRTKSWRQKLAGYVGNESGKSKKPHMAA